VEGLRSKFGDAAAAIHHLWTSSDNSILMQKPPRVPAGDSRQGSGPEYRMAAVHMAVVRGLTRRSSCWR